jgi:hypothetical protein
MRQTRGRQTINLYLAQQRRDPEPKLESESQTKTGLLQNLRLSDPGTERRPASVAGGTCGKFLLSSGQHQVHSTYPFRAVVPSFACLRNWPCGSPSLSLPQSWLLMAAADLSHHEPIFPFCHMPLLITNKITACTLRVLSGFYHIPPFGKACSRAQGTSGFCKDD